MRSKHSFKRRNSFDFGTFKSNESSVEFWSVEFWSLTSKLFSLSSELSILHGTKLFSCCCLLCVILLIQKRGRLFASDRLEVYAVMSEMTDVYWTGDWMRSKLHRTLTIVWWGDETNGMEQIFDEILKKKKNGKIKMHFSANKSQVIGFFSEFPAVQRNLIFERIEMSHQREREQKYVFFNIKFVQFRWVEL